MLTPFMSTVTHYFATLDIWEILGWTAQALFFSRFLVQWVASERGGKSTVPLGFWYLSLCGGSLLFFYAVHLSAWPIVAGQALGVLIYGRNLMLIAKAKREGSALPGTVDLGDRSKEDDRSPPATPAPFDGQVTFLRTADLEEVHAFYHGVLGLPMILDQGACRLYKTGVGSVLGFCTHNGPPPAPESTILTLVTQDVDGWAAKMTAAGYALDTPPQHNPRFNIHHCFVRDPDGHKIEFQTFLDPAWTAAMGPPDRTTTDFRSTPTRQEPQSC